MNLKTLLVISSALLMLYGLGFVVAPVQLMALYNVNLDMDARVIAQLLGAAFMGCGVLNWLARESQSAEIRPVVIWGNLVHFAVGFGVVLLGRLRGAGNALLWMNVGLYLALSMGFLYLQMGKAAP